jgi:hypothetical protein
VRSYGVGDAAFYTDQSLNILSGNTGVIMGPPPGTRRANPPDSEARHP